MPTSQRRHAACRARTTTTPSFLRMPLAPQASPEQLGWAALELRTDATGRLHQHHLTGATIFGASSHRELKTLAVIVDAVNDTHQQPRDHAHHVLAVVDAAVDFQIVRKLAPQPLHKATDSSVGTQALHLWAALRRLPEHVVSHLVKQESHRYSLGKGHIDLHAHNQLAEHMPDGEDPPLQDHMHTHLPPIPHPGEPPAWVPDDGIYNDTGRAYHYPQPIRTRAHIRGSQADNTLMNHLQHKLQTGLYFSALDPSLMPVHLQTRRAQLLLEQLPLLDRVAHWYGRRGIDIPPEYTICPCHLQQPETWEHFKQCPLAKGGNHLAKWTPEDTIAQHARWGPATPPANEVRRLMRQPEIKEAVLRGAVPLQLYRVIADPAQNLGPQYVTCNSPPSRERTHSYSIASRCTHKKHNKHRGTAVCITTSSSTTNKHSPATNNTHKHAATTGELPSHHPPRRTTPKRAHSHIEA